MQSPPSRRAPQGAAPRIAPSASVEAGAELGADVVVGVFCHVASGARIGRGSRLQSHTAVWSGVTLAEDVFVGPHVVFTNVHHPRADRIRRGRSSSRSGWDETHVARGASLCAGAVLIAPVRIGERAVVGAGAVVTRDVPARAVVAGSPARLIGWACDCGFTFTKSVDEPVGAACPDCDERWPGR